VYPVDQILIYQKALSSVLILEDVVATVNYC